MAGPDSQYPQVEQWKHRLVHWPRSRMLSLLCLGLAAVASMGTSAVHSPYLWEAPPSQVENRVLTERNPTLRGVGALTLLEPHVPQVATNGPVWVILEASLLPREILQPTRVTLRLRLWSDTAGPQTVTNQSPFTAVREVVLEPGASGGAANVPRQEQVRVELPHFCQDNTDCAQHLEAAITREAGAGEVEVGARVRVSGFLDPSPVSHPPVNLQLRWEP